MSVGIRRMLVLFVGMALTGAALVGATVSQAQVPCTVDGPTSEHTAAGDPLVLPGTKISFKSLCTGQREVPFEVTIDDGSGNLLFKAAGLTTQSGNVASTNDIFVPVRGARVCVTLGGTKHCVPS